MVAQFQSLLSPFIIIFTVPLAFTGGLIALMVTGEQLSVMSLLGLVILMGTVVNNGIVFVDYANQMRLGGVAKRAALIATGQTRMRPILMTALTTILAMSAMVFSQEITAGMQRGMALVVAGGLLYATFMTLFVVPVIYDLFSRKPLRPIDTGADIDSSVDDAEEIIRRMGPDARETYDYESRRQRRKRLKAQGAHSVEAQEPQGGDEATGGQPRDTIGGRSE
ncbi:MAG: efflux RND transporter permease subunit, partial [Coriobacteriales bacterium]